MVFGQYNTSKDSKASYIKETINQNYDKHNIVDSPAMHKATMKKYKVLGRWYYPSTAKIGQKYIGVASWYGPNFHGKQTSNGEIYDMNKYTAAHKTLPMNTVVKVINLKNNKAVKVRINDRGPFVDDRIIDLSFKAAKDLGVYEHGTTKVQLEVLGFNAAVGADSKTGKEFKEKYLDNINLQIGVFSNKEVAIKIAKNNETNEYASKVIEYEDRKSNRILYRVILKNFKSEEEAKNFKTMMNLENSFITGE